ncbi:MAG TPA: AtpZ/AtpI family protein [bacterium]
MAGPSKQMRLLRFSSIGLEMGAAVLIGLFAGQWADTRWGTTPWLTLVGLGFGMVAGFRALFRLRGDMEGPPKPPSPPPENRNFDA